MGNSSSGPPTGRSSESSDRLYRSLLEATETLIGADVCEFLVEEGDRLVVRASTVPAADRPGEPYPLLTSLPGMAYTSGDACVVDDQLDTRSAASAGSGDASSESRFRSLCCVPMDGDGLLLAKARSPDAFGEADIEVTTRLIESVRTAVESVRTDRVRATDGGSTASRDRDAILEEIADILSHDLKNHLNVASGNLELARESPDEVLLETASRRLDRIDYLVDEVVFLAKTGRYIDRQVPVELRELATAAWESVRTEAAELRVESSVEFVASSRGVEHLLENLIANAVTHAGPQVTVTVGATPDGFYVEDDGPGIPVEEREKVFDRGYSGADDSTGLGLHIAREIVDAHGWTIEATESSAGGARFEVSGVELVGGGRDRPGEDG
jgi:signal transduction histidine kinase